LDGNYSVKVRATDIAGNVAETEIATLVFDRLPPQVGTTVISMGPQIFLPQSGGQIVTLPGLEQRITADAIGGPISIGLVVQKTDSSAALGMTRGVLASESQLFALTKNTDSGLWFGAMSFEAPGTYDVIAMALDGADNRTERVLSQVVVVSPGAVLYGGSGVNSAVVSAYVFDPDLQRFVVWGGEGFGQENPQTVDSNGNYRLILPKGKYYLEVSAPGFRVLRSSVFELDDSLPITWDFVLERDLSRIGGKLPFGLGALFDQLLEVEVVYTELEMGENGLVGQELPVFTLYPSTSLRVENAGAFSNFDLRGKPTLLTVLNTWHPRASEQAAVLNTLAADSSLNIVVLVPQESESGVEVYRNRGGYTDLQFVADPDGSLIEPLGISASPTHYFMDRKGVITSVQVGTLDRNGVLEGLFQ
jgi:hypothetical protein